MIGIINCTSACNLACRYCFEGNWKHHSYNQDKIAMEFQQGMEHFKKFISQIVEMNGSMNETEIILHGGEPFLIKTSLYRQLFEDVKKTGANVQFSVQTNGTIITDDIISLLKDFNIPVGISIDGPAACHDKYRVTKNGGGTSNTILRNIEKLRSHNIRVAALATFTNNNIDDILQVYKFFAEHGIDFSFNPFFLPDESNYTDMKLDIVDYSEKLCRLFDEWISDNSSDITIMPFERILDLITSKDFSMKVCSCLEDCSKSFVAIDTRGNIYPCNHFVGSEQFCYGNIGESNLSELIDSNTRFAQRWEYLKNTHCEGCEIQDFCHGGCPYHVFAAYGNDINHPDFTCQSQKAIVSHIQSIMEKYKNETLS